MTTYEPADFLAKLSTNNLVDLSYPADVSVVGLVKTDQAVPSAIQFSPSFSCQQWMLLPMEMVESIDHLKTVACKDHQHPLVRIKFKRPDETRSDLMFFYNLISRTQATLALALRAAKTRGRTDAPLVRRNDDFCFIWDDPQGLSVCCFYGDELECTGMV